MQQEDPNNYKFLDEESVNYSEKIEKYTNQWKWFVLSIALSFVAAFLYLRYTPNLYQASTSILIDDGSNAGSVNNMAVFENLGLKMGAETLIANEIIILKSKSLMQGVIKDLGFNVSYYEKGLVRDMEIARDKAPIKVTFSAKNRSFYALDTLFKIRIKSATNFALLDAKDKIVSEHVFGKNIASPLGNFTITPTSISKNNFNREVTVKISPLKSVAAYYMSQLSVDYVTEDSEILQLSLKDKNQVNAEMLLNKLILNYNQNTVENKSLIAQNTNEFITKRLNVIKNDLSDIDKGIQNFKTTNKLTDIPLEAELTLNTTFGTAKRIIDLNTQLKISTYFSEYLASSPDELIPANLGLADGLISENTLKYNELLLERNRILKSTGPLNPVILNLNSQIKELRRSISESLKNLISSVTISLNAMNQQEKLLNTKIIGVPSQEREYRDIQRQQQIVESLYLYLLQKREENTIALAAKMPNAKIIDGAEESAKLISPERNKVYLIAFLVGFLIAFFVFYIKFLFDNKVHTATEVEQIFKKPLLGSIPKSKAVENKVVVFNKERYNEAEAFRILRTNLNFILGNTKNACKTIYVTSTIPHEGKTFISINIASVLALSNKKVLLIDADLRKPKIAEYLNISLKKGLTNFLVEDQLNTSDIIKPIPELNFDVVQSGIVLSNPAELLMNGRFEELVADAKTKYDYIIIDTSPISLVSDSLLLCQKADLLLYVVRANYIDKNMLQIPKKLYKENKLPNLAVVLNDIELKEAYGYAYGENESKKPWWKKKMKIKE